MSDHHKPTAQELIEMVRTWLKSEVMPELEGYAAFRGRVALSALATVQRELELRPAADAAASARLTELLGRDGSLEELETLLCERIRTGELGLGDGALMAHLRRTVMDRLAIDQPRYASYLSALARER